MDINNPCYKPEELDIMHWIRIDTGYPGSNTISHREGTVWQCDCGIRQEVIIKR